VWTNVYAPGVAPRKQSQITYSRAAVCHPGAAVVCVRPAVSHVTI